MNANHIAAALEAILPFATKWAEEQANFIRERGRHLDNRLLSLAKSVGVQEPGNIRILEVETIPTPDHPVLAEAASVTGLLSPDTIGLTLFYGIYIKSGQATDRLLSHEFRHVAQYESAGSMQAFLKEYLRQIFTIGYIDSPLEADARSFESVALPQRRNMAQRF